MHREFMHLEVWIVDGIRMLHGIVYSVVLTACQHLVLEPPCSIVLSHRLPRQPCFLAATQPLTQ